MRRFAPIRFADNQAVLEVGEEGLRQHMERYRTIRAYSAGGVVFRLVPLDYAGQDGSPRWPVEKQPVHIEVALVGRSHPGIWSLPKGTPRAGETIEQVAAREVQE